MKDLQRVSKGVILKTISNVLVVLLGLATSVLLNRHFGKQMYGLLILSYAVINFAWSFSGLGARRTINRLIPKAISEKRNSELSPLVKTAFTFQSFGALAFALAVFFSANFIAVSLFRRPELKQFIQLGAIMLMGTSMVEFASQFYQAFQDWHRDSLLNVFYPMVYLILIISGIFLFNISILGVILANALACGLSILLAAMILPSRIKTIIGARTKLLDYQKSGKRIFSFGTPLLFNNLSFFLLTWFDKALLGRFRPIEELTFYYIAVTFMNGLVVLFKSLVVVFMPYLAGLSSATEEIKKDKFTLLFRWFFHISLLASMVAFFLIKPVVLKLYGNDYGPTVIAFRMLLLLFISRSMANLPNIFLTNVYGRVKQMVGIITVLVIANVVLNSLFVPRFGYQGAILAAISAYSIYWVTVFTRIKLIRNKVPFKAILKTLVIIALVFFLYLILRKAGIRLPYIYALVLPLFYLILLKLFNEITTRDIRITQEIFNTL